MSKNIELFDLYKNNKDFKAYVDKYSRAHGRLFPEDCFYDLVVMNYAEYLRGRDK